MASADSFNGERPLPVYNPGQSSFVTWFAPDSFGGTNYSNIPVGAITHVLEPFDLDDGYQYYGGWASERCFATSAYSSIAKGLESKLVAQAVGDPFVRK